MGSILLVYERVIPTVELLKHEFNRIAEKRGIEVQHKRIKQVAPKDLEIVDVVLFIRPNDMLSVKIAKAAKMMGCLVVAYFDDDLLNASCGVHSLLWRKCAIRRVLSYSDVVMSCSRYILEKYKELSFGKRTAYKDTVVGDDEIKVAYELSDRKEGELVKIVYAAAPAHITSFNKYVLPIFHRLVERYGKKMSFTFIGVRPDLKKYEDKTHIICVDALPLDEYRKYMEKENFDIGLAPLPSDEFSKCKYFNKFIEYTMEGVVGVYAKKEPYIYVVEEKKNGFFAEDAPECWYKSLVEAIDNEELRRKCLYNAISCLDSRFNFESITEQLFLDLPELESSRNVKKKCKKWWNVEYIFLSIVEDFFRLIMVIKNGGMQAIIRKLLKAGRMK